MLSLFSHSNKKAPKSHNSQQHSFLPKLDFGEDVDLAVGLGSAAVSVDQFLKASKSHHHKTSHYVKAGLASVLSAGAFAMMAHDHSDDTSRSRTHSHSHRSPSPPPPKHRDRLRRSASSPDLPRFQRPDDYERDERAYYSDDESETHHPHGRRPRLPYNDDDHERRNDDGDGQRERRKISHSRRRHSFGVFEERDRHLSPERQRRRRSLHHRSPSPSPPRHRNASVG